MRPPLEPKVAHIQPRIISAPCSWRRSEAEDGLVPRRVGTPRTRRRGAYSPVQPRAASEAGHWWKITNSRARAHVGRSTTRAHCATPAPCARPWDPRPSAFKDPPPWVRSRPQPRDQRGADQSVPHRRRRHMGRTAAPRRRARPVLRALNSTNAPSSAGDESYVAAGAANHRDDTFPRTGSTSRSSASRRGVRVRLPRALLKSSPWRHVLSQAASGARDRGQTRRTYEAHRDPGADRAPPRRRRSLPLETFTNLTGNPPRSAPRRRPRGLPVLARWRSTRAGAVSAARRVAPRSRRAPRAGWRGRQLRTRFRGRARRRREDGGAHRRADQRVSQCRLPELRDGRFVYEQPVSYMAEMAERMARRGRTSSAALRYDQAIAAIAADRRQAPPPRTQPCRDATVARAEGPAAPSDAKKGRLPRASGATAVVVELRSPRHAHRPGRRGRARACAAGAPHLDGGERSRRSAWATGMAYVAATPASNRSFTSPAGRKHARSPTAIMGAAARGISACSRSPATRLYAARAASRRYDVDSVGLLRSSRR
jgi:hypothetical protein